MSFTDFPISILVSHQTCWQAVVLFDYKDLYLLKQFTRDNQLISLSRVLKVIEPRFKGSVLTALTIICLSVGVPHFKDNVIVARYMSTAPTDFASTSYGQIYEHRSSYLPPPISLYSM